MVKCSDCGFCGDHYLNGIDGMGIFRFHVCVIDFITPVLVDAEAQRECQAFEPKEKEEVKH